MSNLSFGMLVPQDAPVDELKRRWRLLEQAGVDAVYVADHTGDYRNLSGYWLDGWTALTVMARTTESVRIGTLVTNPILRAPIAVAKAAVTVDHLSNGRLDLGIGTGIAPFDHAAAGVPYWAPRERADRFREYVDVLDGLLRSTEIPYTFAGRYHSTDSVTLVPPPVQRPRPPIIVGGQSPTARRVAAERAEVWNTHGPFGAGVDTILEVTRLQNAEVDGWCEQAGRDPVTLRRSLLLFEGLDPWGASGDLPRLVERFRAVGITDFVGIWPETVQRRKVFDEIVTNVIPDLRR